MLYFYLYSITGLSLLVFYFSVISGVNGFYDFIFHVPLKPYESVPPYEGAIAGGLGFALVSLPIWLYHWRRVLRESVDFTENMLSAHRFYLFTVVCLLMLMIIITGGSGLAAVLRMAFGFGQGRAHNLSGAASTMTIFLVSGGFWLHHWMQFRGRFGSLAGLVKSADAGSGASE